MKIDASAIYPFAGQRNHAPARANTQDFAAMLSQRTAEMQGSPAGSSRPDFTSMTRQELRDWMNEQLRSGEMTVDESTAFLGWTVDVRIDASGRAISHDGDYTTRFNFLDLMSGNRDFYLQRGDLDAATRIQDALDLMERSQGASIRI